MRKGNALVYWAKVVSLGLILGLGLQFAQAWVAPTVTPPGGNVAGPITTTTDPTAYQTRGAGLGMTGSLRITNTTTSTGTQNNMITTPKLCFNNDGSETNCVTDPSGITGGWVDVPLNDSADFDERCEYRVKVRNNQYQGYVGDENYFYVNGVDTRHIVYISHNGTISHINSDSKTVYRVNGVSNANYPVIQKIEKSCGRAGGGGSGSGDNLGNHSVDLVSEIACDASKSETTAIGLYCIPNGSPESGSDPCGGAKDSLGLCTCTKTGSVWEWKKGGYHCR